MYFYLNQLEPKLALTAFLSTEAGVLVGVNYYRTTDFLCQHLKKKKKSRGVKRLLIYSLNSKNQEPRNSFLDVIFVQVEYSVYLFEFSRTFQIHYFFFPLHYICSFYFFFSVIIIIGIYWKHKFWVIFDFLDTRWMSRNILKSVGGANASDSENQDLFCKGF